jgi:hypothetical protein
MVFMARPIDVDFLNQLRTHLKAEWMKNGGQQFAKTLDQLAIELTGLPKEKIKSSLKNKIFNYLNMLERGGSIKIIRGEGSKSNEFIYVDDKIVGDFIETKNTITESIDDFVKKSTAALQLGIDLNTQLSQQLIEQKGENNFLKQAILSLEPWGTDPNGVIMYRLKKGSDLPQIIEKLQKELETNSTQ